MTRIDIDAALAAANPLTDGDAAALPLREAEFELVERIVAISVSPALPRARAGVFDHRRRLALLLAVTAAVAALLAVLPSGRHDGAPAPAFAAPLVRFANGSPLVLLQLPGWHVVYADEAADGFGEMHFVRGAADANGNPQGASFSSQVSLAGRVASLTWAPQNLNGETRLANESSVAGDWPRRDRASADLRGRVAPGVRHQRTIHLPRPRAGVPGDRHRHGHVR